MENEIITADYAASKKKVDDVLALQKITADDLSSLTRMERDYLSETITDSLNSLKGEEKDNFLCKVDAIIAPASKNQFWEHNHHLISEAISRLMRQYGYMPSNNAIARETGLSRPTIVKHLKEYKTSPEFAAETERFRFMTPKLLAAVYKRGCEGDMRAAKLYFEMTGSLIKQRAGNIVNSQNNFLQINNTILSAETLQKLSSEQLNQIEHMIREIGDAR
ncbi:hypothetical protein [Mucilaginibacter sp. L3T2-6]|uniref:hypothetical protein n=1 Tax=Mucilaginibacter sp. L3T2-6 TaxID=3062491 RepID=UPI00267458F1|nr:hypothetical protein [Mucilaginibacter sp. L3T2-6]MDO3640930.1 hypothetical protein [Mucilaginibacter sp. L3T2-6]MDV6213594.1 hypothetical protein [Mucilaginibacter sp. L3T2-6]